MLGFALNLSSVGLFKKFKSLEIDTCHFVNLPEPKGGRWGQRLTAAKMKECTWLKPQLVANRVPGVDRRQSPAPFKIRRPA